MNNSQLLMPKNFTRQEYYRKVAEGTGIISEDALAYSLRKDLSELLQTLKTRIPPENFYRTFNF